MSSTLETTIVLPTIFVIILSLIIIGSNLCEKTQKELEIEYISITNRNETDKLYNVKIISDQESDIRTKSITINPIPFVLTVDYIIDICGPLNNIRKELIDIFGNMS